MKKAFSPAWNSSSQPRKQRKFRHNAPLHVKHKFLSSHLSKALREKYSKRSLPLKKGDEVLVMRGGFKKKTAKISSIDLKGSRVALEGLQRSKRDGTKVNVYFKPHILLIQALNLEDKERLAIFSRKASVPTVTESKQEVKTETKKEKKETSQTKKK